MLINLTAHDVVIAIGDRTITVPPEGTVARLVADQEVVGEADGIPIVRTRFGTVSGLPEPRPGVTYIVSCLVAQAVKRPDVVTPDTGPTAIRENGQIVAVRRFQVF